VVQGDPDEFVKNSHKMSPNAFFCRNNYITLISEKEAKLLGDFYNCQKTAQNSRSPKRQKIAQSGHPAKEPVSVMAKGKA
jgi:hypothetical protein